MSGKMLISVGASATTASSSRPTAKKVVHIIRILLRSGKTYR